LDHQNIVVIIENPGYWSFQTSIPDPILKRISGSTWNQAQNWCDNFLSKIITSQRLPKAINTADEGDLIGIGTQQPFA
jgi:hypothetical protein